MSVEYDEHEWTTLLFAPLWVFEAVARADGEVSDEEWQALFNACLLYTSDAADALLCVDLGGRRIIKKKKIIVTRLRLWCRRLLSTSYHQLQHICAHP